MKALLAIFILVAQGSLSASNVIVLYDDIVISLPDTTKIKGSNNFINFDNFESVYDEMNKLESITLIPAKGIELEIGISENAKFVSHINETTRMAWLTFQTQMLQAQIIDVRKRSDKRAASSTGVNLGNKYRALLARSAWYLEGEMHNLLVFDIFHKENYIGIIFKWTAKENSKSEAIIDKIVTSIKLSE